MEKVSIKTIDSVFVDLKRNAKSKGKELDTDVLFVLYNGIKQHYSTSPVGNGKDHKLMVAGSIQELAETTLEYDIELKDRKHLEAVLDIIEDAS